MTDITDKCLQYNKMTLPLQLGLMWRASGEGAPKFVWGHSRQFTYWRKVPCDTLYISPPCLAWKLSSLSERFHVLEINIILLFSILFSMQSECGSFHFHGSNLFSFVALLNPTLLPTQVWEKLWEHKKSGTFGQRLGWLRNIFVIVFKGKWEIRYSFLDSLE